MKRRELKGQNVIGELSGSSDDGEEDDTHVILTSHHDHLGRRRGKTKTKEEGVKSLEEVEDFYPGALDNASGVAKLLELARLVAELKQHGKCCKRKVRSPFASLMWSKFVGAYEVRFMCLSVVCGDHADGGGGDLTGLCLLCFSSYYSSPFLCGGDQHGRDERVGGDERRCGNRIGTINVGVVPRRSCMDGRTGAHAGSFAGTGPVFSK